MFKRDKLFNALEGFDGMASEAKLGEWFKITNSLHDIQIILADINLLNTAELSNLRKPFRCDLVLA